MRILVSCPLYLVPYPFFPNSTYFSGSRGASRRFILSTGYRYVPFFLMIPRLSATDWKRDRGMMKILVRPFESPDYFLALPGQFDCRRKCCGFDVFIDRIAQSFQNIGHGNLRRKYTQFNISQISYLKRISCQL